MSDPTRLILTRVIEDVASFRPEPESTYLTGASMEERSDHLRHWQDQASRVRMVRLTSTGGSSIVVDRPESAPETYALRDAQRLQILVEEGSPSAVYVDITGMPHQVWAPVVRAVWQVEVPSYAIYAEPADYRASAMPTVGTTFDLSERIEGIRALPGFLNLDRDLDRDYTFVPLLGFEGARFSFLLEAVTPDVRRTVPIVGVPGFRPEYPFHAYWGNRAPLLDTLAWQRVRFVRANCPFSLVYQLEDLKRDLQARYLRIGMIGTKPHALGAVLYFLKNPDRVELIHDHPVRKARGTEGVSRICLYPLSAFRQKWGERPLAA